MLLKRRLSVVWAAAIMLLTVLLASGAALGITNGTADGERHPYVGALVDKFGDQTYPYCTGTLISPTVLLTAAHCYPETKDHFYVTFKEMPTSDKIKDEGITGTWHEHPTIDIGVVKFANPPFPDPDPDDPNVEPPVKPANLPTLNQVAIDAKSTDPTKKFTAVGYGGKLAPKSPGGPEIVYDNQREWAVSTYKSFNGTYLRLSQNQGSGGTCYGDSGGPNFFGEYPYPDDVPTIASITITGDNWCKSTNVTLRLDTAPVREFLTEQGVTPP